MKIALLTTDSNPMVGGVSNYLHNLCLEIIKYDSLAVYSSVPSNIIFDKKLPYPIHRITDTRRLGQRRGDGLMPLRKLNTLTWYLKRPFEARQLLRRIRRECDPNIVLIGRWEERSHYWCRACRAKRIPYCLFAYGMELSEVKSPKWQGRRQEDYLQANRVISISHSTSKLVKRYGVPEDKIVLLHPGINTENLHPLPPGTLEHILSQFGLVENQFILSLARLIPRKGIDLAIRAFSEIASDSAELVLVVAGDGPEAPNLQSLVNNLSLGHRVRLLGTVTHEMKRALLQGCLFFIMPNRPVSGDMEGFGIVFLEAAIYCKAVIGGNNGGVPDAVIDGQTGLLVNTSGSHSSLAQAMRQLLADLELRAMLGKNGRERTTKDFSWNILGLRLIEGLCRLGQESKAPCA